MLENIKATEKYIKVELPANIAAYLTAVLEFAHEKMRTEILIKNYIIGRPGLPESRIKQREPLQKKWFNEFSKRYPNYNQRKYLNKKFTKTPTYAIYTHFEINVSEEDLWKMVNVCIKQRFSDIDCIRYNKEGSSYKRTSID